MIDWKRWSQGLLLTVDMLFDAGGNLLRVLVRGKFQPDGRSFRGARYVELMPKELLIQTVALNASDESEAHKIIELDLERYLPFEKEQALFDVSGPVDGRGEADTAERSFLLGVTRPEVLEEAAGETRRLFGGAEGFTYHPADHPRHVLLFRNAACHRRRRIRRLLLAMTMLAFAWSTLEAYRAWGGALSRAEVTARREQAAALGKVRRAERRLAEVQQAAATAQKSAVHPAVAIDDMAALSRLLPQDAELTEVVWRIDGMSIQGRSYKPDTTELALRRGFQSRGVDVQWPDTGVPSRFTATVLPAPVAASGKAQVSGEPVGHVAGEAPR